MLEVDVRKGRGGKPHASHADKSEREHAVGVFFAGVLYLPPLLLLRRPINTILVSLQICLGPIHCNLISFLVSKIM